LLLVEDNVTTSRYISQLLPQELYVASVARTVKQAREFLTRTHFDLVILDRILPDGDGLNIAEDLYWAHREIPVLILSEKDAVEERVRGLKKGADDYLAKPFSMEELLLRISSLLSKTKQLDTYALHVGEVRMFPHTGLAFVKDAPVYLRKRESQILSFLIRHKNQVVSRDMLIENIWRSETVPEDETVDVYVRRIRMQLGKEGYTLKTIRGYGYLLKDA
jgi:DNA-binding response OmpR family regulator